MKNWSWKWYQFNSVCHNKEIFKQFYNSNGHNSRKNNRSVLVFELVWDVVALNLWYKFRKNPVRNVGVIAFTSRTDGQTDGHRHFYVPRSALRRGSKSQDPVWHLEKKSGQCFTRKKGRMQVVQIKLMVSLEKNSTHA